MKKHISDFLWFFWFTERFWINEKKEIYEELFNFNNPAFTLLLLLTAPLLFVVAATTIFLKTFNEQALVNFGGMLYRLVEHLEYVSQVFSTKEKVSRLEWMRKDD